MEFYLQIVAAILALVAAVCWFYASVVKVQPITEPDQSGFIPASYGTRKADVALTMQAQSRWNAKAACFAGLAALVQALVLVIT
mgnify:CR=1 FL=1